MYQGRGVAYSQKDGYYCLKHAKLLYSVHNVDKQNEKDGASFHHPLSRMAKTTFFTPDGSGDKAFPRAKVDSSYFTQRAPEERAPGSEEGEVHVQDP